MPSVPWRAKFIVLQPLYLQISAQSVARFDNRDNFPETSRAGGFLSLAAAIPGEFVPPRA